MEEDKNIYQQAESGPGDDARKLTVELTMAEARRRTIRSVTIVVLGGALILAAVILTILPKETAKPKAAASETETAARPEPGVPVPALVAPELETMTRRALEELETVSQKETVNPQQAAEAMGEIRIARKLAGEKNWDEAEEHVRKALSDYPGMNTAQRLLGFIYLQRGQFDQAIAVLEQARQQDPFNAETFNNLASAYMQRADMDKAEELLLASLQIQPDYTLSYLNLGLLYLARGEYQLALDNLEQALPAVPDDANVRNNLGVALLRLGRFSEARDHFQIILNQNPEMAPAYFNTAITYVLEGDAQKAMDWIEDGAEHCSPSVLRGFLKDTDFDPIRENERFQYIMGRLSPQVPAGPGSKP